MHFFFYNEFDLIIFENFLNKHKKTLMEHKLDKEIFLLKILQIYHHLMNLFKKKLSFRKLIFRDKFI